MFDISIKRCIFEDDIDRLIEINCWIYTSMGVTIVNLSFAPSQCFAATRHIDIQYWLCSLFIAW